MTPSLTLISHVLCPYVQRVAITLAEKQLPFTRIDIDLANKPAWFLAISPLGKTPVLLVEQQAIFESAVICEYLEDCFEPTLHPAEPLARAQHRAWIEVASAILNSIAALYNAADAASLAAKTALLAQQFASLERVLSDNTDAEPSFAGPYVAGQRFSLVDAAFAPVFRYFDVLDTVVDLAVFAHTPAVLQWRQHLATRPSVLAAVVENYPSLLLEFLTTRPSELARRIKGSTSVNTTTSATSTP